MTHHTYDGRSPRVKRLVVGRDLPDDDHMTSFDKNYLAFYIDGRENPFANAVDLEPLARRLLNGESVRVLSMEAATDIAKGYTRDGSQRVWGKRAKIKREVEAAGGDVSIAWTMYLQGQTEAFATGLESEILDEADGILDAESDDDDDDDDESEPESDD